MSKKFPTSIGGGMNGAVLDYVHMVIVGKLLKQLAESGHTVFVSTHDSELVEICCDHIMYIKNGKVVRFE